MYKISLISLFIFNRFNIMTFSILFCSKNLNSFAPEKFMRMREEEIEKLRGVVRDCLSKHLYSSAIFFADKVTAFTEDPADIYMQAQALFLGRHFRRAFHLLNASKIVLRDPRFRYLAAKCLVSYSILHCLSVFLCWLWTSYVFLCAFGFDELGIILVNYVYGVNIGNWISFLQ